MPDFAVDRDGVTETPQGLLNDLAELQDKLVEVRGKVQDLLSQGYRTPAVQRKFQPSFDEFARGFDQVNHGLRGIGNYINAVGDPHPDRDSKIT